MGAADIKMVDGDQKPKEAVNVDEFLQHVGEFGRMQVYLQIMFCLLIIPSTYQKFIGTFVGSNPPWQCTGIHRECNTTGVIYEIGDPMYNKRCDLQNRSSWEFTKPKKYSIVTEWDLICDKKELSYLANSAVYIGMAVGAFVLMALSDRFGRKKVLFPSAAGILVSGFISAFVQHFWLFFALRLVIGIFLAGISLSIFIVATELVGPNYRALSGSLIWFSFTLTLCLIGMQAWLLPDWRLLEMIVSAPYIFVLGFWWCIPESVRWLRVNNKLDEAESVLQKVAKVNKRPKPSVKLSKAEESTESGTYADLFRPWKVCKSSLIQSYAWFVNGMVYYGIAMASDNLGGDMYRDFVLTSLVEIPANILVIIFGNRYGRKPTTIWAMIFGALSCGGVAFIPSDTNMPGYNWSRVALGMMGKLCITLSFNELYLWSVELHPTVVRSQGMGVLQITSRLGAASAPWVAQWLRHFHTSLPFILMGALTATAAFLCFLLKETKGMQTAEVLEKTNTTQGIEIIEMNQVKHLETTAQKTALTDA